MARFVDRHEELSQLMRWADSGRGELIVVWGRRRVGKTELLARLLDDRRGVLFEATEGVAGDHLSDFGALIAEATDDRVLAAQPLTNWAAAFAAIERMAEAGPAIVILDEFQWVARAEPAIGSILNRWWRTRGRELPLMLVLCGSQVGFFEREVLTGATYGRRTGQLALAPLDCRSAAEFFPSWSAIDRVRAYAVCGGVPYYLEQFDERHGLAISIRDAVLRRGGVLREEARLILNEELPDPARHFSILRAIANGATKFNEITQRTGLGDDFVAQALALQQSLHLVRKVVPVTVANPQRTRLTRYEIADGYLRFFFRFVLPYEARLQRDADAQTHLDTTILPELDHFVSKPAFEEVCRQHVMAREPGAVAVGAWWGSVREARRSIQREIDIVALTDAGAAAVGTCKWTGQPIDVADIQDLDRVARHVPGIVANPAVWVFSRSGFADRLLAHAEGGTTRYHLVGPDELLA